RNTFQMATSAARRPVHSPATVAARWPARPRPLQGSGLTAVWGATRHFDSRLSEKSFLDDRRPITRNPTDVFPLVEADIGGVRQHPPEGVDVPAVRSRGPDAVLV